MKNYKTESEINCPGCGVHIDTEFYFPSYWPDDGQLNEDVECRNCGVKFHVNEISMYEISWVTDAGEIVPPLVGRPDRRRE